jgi:hypothetical protein
MNSTRSRVAIGAALLTASFFVFSVASAQGLSDRMKATIPFGFYVGDQLLPAGEYEVRTVTGGVARLYNSETNTSATFNTVRLSNPIQGSASGKLVFNRYGDDYFLSQMWWTGQQDGLQPLPSKRERELAGLNTPNTPVGISVAR